MSQYVVTIRYEAFGSLPGGQSALNSSSVLALNDARNQRRASRSRSSRRMSYSLRIRLTSSYVARATPLFIVGILLLSGLPAPLLLNIVAVRPAAHEKLSALH